MLFCVTSTHNSQYLWVRSHIILEETFPQRLQEHQEIWHHYDAHQQQRVELLFHVTSQRLWTGQSGQDQQRPLQHR